MEFTKFLKRARELRESQFDNEYEYFELLIKQEEDLLSWESKYDSWADVLTTEGLIAVSAYRKYKKTRGAIPTVWIKKLGVYASMSIVALDKETRDTVFTQVKSWHSRHQTAPTYQRVSKYVRDLGRSSRKKKVSTKTQKMLTYIRVCQGLLRDNKIPYPKEPWK